MFSCSFGTYRYIRLLFGVAPAEDMFQKKIDELFSGIPNIFSIDYDILIADFDEQGKDHNKTLEKVPWVCTQTT